MTAARPEQVVYAEQFGHPAGREREEVSSHTADWMSGETAVTFASVVLIVALAAHARKRFMGNSRAERKSMSDAMPESAVVDYEEWRLADNRFCPLCLHEFEWPIDQCEDCAVALVDEEELPAETSVLIEECVIPVMRLQNIATAHLARSFLLANQVPCSLRNSLWNAPSSDVLVFESDALRAKRLLNRFLFAAAA